MLKTTEYTPGQTIRFEATSLYHNALRLRETMLESQPALDFLDTPAASGMRSVKMDPEGRFRGINRSVEYYESLIEALEQARRQTERGPVSKNSRQAWLLLNRCRYHCMTVLSMMESRERVPRAGGRDPPRP
jgi:hypothetical protein